MFSWLARMASACWKPVRRYARMNKDDEEDCSLEDSLLWSRELEKHSYGEFSFAVVQANEVIEDCSQVEAGRDATFVGVYDGHGGPDASRFICDHLFKNLMRLAQENGTITEDILRSAFSATEEGFLTLVRRAWGIRPVIAAMGSCCLVGVIWRGILYVGNVGDSRAVIGSLGKSSKIVAEQLTRDHNASIEEVRQELRSLHPDDSHIVVMKHGVWRIKGIIQVSRSIGDAYLKRPEFSLDPSFPRFHLAEPLRRPVLSAEPSVSTRVLQPNDKFLIFASDGLWEHLTNQQAVEIVYNNPRAGIAKRLVKTALTEAARKREMRYNDLKKLEKGIRRFFHDDITVVVIFLDHELQGKKAHAPELSVRGFSDTVGPSNFNVLRGIDENGRSAG
ncbi:probable protein phosphatase 2C 68 [Momordica charantia]|uniref:protein-serine/threonine phosphatase n=1 Tax=Momordica charantia TaxID=3673 RepID=A0A6J1DZ53_MOMCH|nr:probable protein phosphatase 2C 68 [Momordica charantia]XP_022158347.1 probable protein phosphatase 2C 68 [Momordica charantia]XP_022158348.1 probable protein phosphatase 2C 68 [Momordica charantia]XP_022158349.1 probable protein phosphatase 2C 68 [Momordica charantia]